MISEIIINACLVTFMLAIALFVVQTRRVIFTILLTGTYSLVAALMFVSLDAVDVAFTEASVGAGISTILFLAALSYLPKEEVKESFNKKHIYALTTCVLIGGLLINLFPFAPSANFFNNWISIINYFPVIYLMYDRNFK